MEGLTRLSTVQPRRRGRSSHPRTVRRDWLIACCRDSRSRYTRPLLSRPRNRNTGSRSRHAGSGSRPGRRCNGAMTSARRLHARPPRRLIDGGAAAERVLRWRPRCGQCQARTAGAAPGADGRALGGAVRKGVGVRRSITTSRDAKLLSFRPRTTSRPHTPSANPAAGSANAQAAPEATDYCPSCPYRAHRASSHEIRQQPLLWRGCVSNVGTIVVPAFTGSHAIVDNASTPTHADSQSQMGPRRGGVRPSSCRTAPPH
ncbi:hypothetical protein MBT84_46145 [Streptomyces sp. MBT84]|nr:hypothetical protein [Streptomyces sp. MBT84]